MATRILVVDDHPVNLKLACEVLEHASYLVERASSAEEALARIKAAVPDLILVDIAMPGMDGLTLTRILRADPSTRHLLIVALSAFAMKRDEERTLEAGCDAYISKPIDTRTFADRVAAILRTSRDRYADVT